jgi:hypothetical protein
MMIRNSKGLYDIEVQLGYKVVAQSNFLDAKPENWWKA